MEDSRPSAKRLQSEAKQRQKAKKTTFDTILDKVYNRILSKSKLDWRRIVYEVPLFVVGLPAYDVTECTSYIAKNLQKDGYIIEIYGERVIYISWDSHEEIS
ncbi:hypothetical protein TetV_569 [Tetraselmis virus 1]|uniref:Uncharacterized protein n=1 Tax=Tetraselmis virus 1 TaxID=2060617 RepID=A0A2P0VP30_9VIRU|nr:hypothetical protein QJ968_gp485 [Tetraselmis virus 1]AUF82651.1 hypothetical protein TetV_569 [Tetraselmis virus 1]